MQTKFPRNSRLNSWRGFAFGIPRKVLALLGAISLVSATLLTYSVRSASAAPLGWVGVDKAASPNTSDRCPNGQSIVKWTPLKVDGARTNDAGSGNPDNNFHLDYKYDPVTRLLHIYNVYFQDNPNAGTPIYPVSYSLVLLQQPGGAESTDWSGPLQPGLSANPNGETFRYDLPGDATFTNTKTPQYAFLCVSTNFFFVSKVTSPAVAGVSFTFNVTCGAVTTVLTLLTGADGTAKIAFPSAVACTVVESPLPSNTAVSYSTNCANSTPIVPVNVTSAIPPTCTITNSAIRTLTVTKAVTGLASVTETAGPFTYTLTCTLNGTPVIPTAVSGADGSIAGGASENWTVPQGTACTVAETGGASLFNITYAQAPTLTTNQTATITNARKVGSLSVLKTAVGYPAGSTFTFVVDCAIDAFDKTWLASPPTDVRTITGIPTGTSCTVTESGAGAATTVIVETPATAAADGIVTIAEGANSVAFTNSLKGTLTVTKDIQGVVLPGDPIAFTYTVNCGTGAATQLTGDGSLTDLESETWSVNPGAGCTVTETGPAGQLALYETSVGGDLGLSKAFAVPAGSTPTITIINNRIVAKIAVTKTVVGPVLSTDPTDFTYALACTPAAKLAIAGANSVLAHGATEEWWVNDTASCSATEPGLPAIFTPTISAAVTANKSATNTITITNTRALGDITISKISDAPGTFLFSASCNSGAQTASGSAVFAAAGTQVVSLTWAPTKPPTGSTCAVTETDNPLFTSAVTVGSATLTVPGSVEFTNTRKTETLIVSKTADAPGVFNFDVVCGGVKVATGVATISAAAGGTVNAVLTPTPVVVPTTTPCTVTEVSADPALSNWTTDPVSRAVTQTSDTTPGFTFAFTNTRLKGSLIVQKTTNGGIGGPFSISVDCKVGSASITGFPQVVSITTATAGTPAAAATITGVPTGATCGATETLTAAQDLRWTKTEPAAQVMGTSGMTFTVVNDRKTGDLLITKSVVIPGAVGGTGSLIPASSSFDVACAGVAGYPKTVTVATPTPGSLTLSGIPTESNCTVTENPVPAAFTVSPAAAMTIEAIKIGTNTAAFTNTLKTTTVTPHKVVVGQPVGVAAGPFTFGLVCTSGSWSSTTAVSITVPAGSTSADGTAVTVPYGANCTLTETAQPKYLTADLDDAASGIISPTVLSVSNTAKAMTLDLTKMANASTVRPNTSVTYTVTVENKGNYPLPAAEFTVGDNTCSPLAKQSESLSADNVLQVGEVWTYTCAKVLTADTTNVATVTWTDPITNAPKTDTDSKFVDVIRPGIQITKSADKTTIHSGDTVKYTYTVKNTGDDPLSTVIVSDDVCSPVAYVSGDTNTNSKLETTETWTFTCTQVLTDAKVNLAPNKVKNTASASGKDSLNGAVSSDQATWTVTILHPAIDVTKSPSVTQVRAGDPVTYTYVVTNPGDAALATVTVTDNKCTSPLYGSGDTNSDSLLDVGESWTYTCTQTLSATTTNVVTASGTDSIGRTVTDTATATVSLIIPGLGITKSASAASVAPGTQVTYTYKVTNTGDSVLINVKVVDDKCSPLSAPSGDNGNGKLDVGETWTYTCTQAIVTATVNTATATAVDVTGKTLTTTATATVTVTSTTTTTTTTATTTTPTTTTTAAPPAALVFPTIPTVPPTTVAAAAVVAPTPAPAIVPIAVLAASVPTTTPVNVLGVQVAQTEPAFTGPSSSTNSAGLMGLVALLAGLTLLGGQRIVRIRRRTR